MTSIEQLNRVITILGEDWKEQLDKFLKDDDVNIDEALEGEIIKFLSICKEEIMDNNISGQKQVEELIDNDLLYKNIQEFLQKQLKAYYATSALRTMAALDAEKAKTAVEEILSMTILRFNPQIIEDFEKYGYTSEEYFIDFLNILDSMVMLMVRKNLHIDAIEKYIYVNTRLPQGVCKKMAKIIDKNFTELKMNYIIDTLGKME